jgi:hypothetical protein
MEGIMNKLNTAKRAQILGMLVEGNSMRAVSRMADCSINTATKLRDDVGPACSQYQHEMLRNLPLASISSATRYGHSAIPSKRTYRKIVEGGYLG